MILWIFYCVGGEDARRRREESCVVEGRLRIV
jgi:hypothetical protein